MSILRPNRILQTGAVSITTKRSHLIGFVTKRLSDLIEIRDIAGKVTTLNAEVSASCQYP